MSVIGSNIIAGASGTVETGYQIARSLRFNSADSAYLNRTPGSAGNRKTWTWSGWVKRSALGAVQNLLMAGTSSTDFLTCQIDANNKLSVQGITGNVENIRLVSTPVYRDVSAWYNIVFVLDLNNATQADRFRIYVNGVRVTAFDTNTNSLASTQSYEINNTVAHAMGRNTISSSVYVDLYYADLILIDGQALEPTSFGETDSATGVWVPKAYTGTYGTNGFWLKLDDNSNTTATTLGKDYSGNGNNWTPNNFSVTAGVGNDSLVDSPTNYGTDTGAGGEVRGNYATLNPLVASTGATLTNGNLDVVGTTTAYANSRATFQLNSGKWYWEVTLTGSGAAGFPWGVGLTTEAGPASSSNITQTGFYSVWNGNTGNVNKTTNGGTAVLIATTNWAQNDVIMVAYDADTGNIWFGRNGTWYPPTNGGSAGNPAAGTNVTISGVSGLIPVCHTYSTSSNQVVNFGQRAFAYTAPSGFKALCTTNLPTPAIGASASTLASKNFGIVAWTGTDTTQNRSITGVGFQPDFVWSKSRSSAYSHPWYDAVRGVGKGLFSNVTDAEYTNEASGYISSFDSDGFTAAKGSANNNFFNQLNVTYVAWNWKANGAGVSNTAGSISSTVSANQTAGISIVTFATGTISTSATVGHGLGVAPAMIITKTRGTTGNWATYHRSIGAGQIVYLDATNAAATASGPWNNTTPSSSVFTIGSGFSALGNMVAYCFAEIAGFSRFGSYTGNGSADGPFVYCGFRPRYILMKRTDAVTDWEILDTLRDPYNAAANLLQPNLTSAESSTGGPWYDILSNGFKVRTTNTFFNASGGTYIFAAFAEAPFNYARAR